MNHRTATGQRANPRAVPSLLAGSGAWRQLSIAAAVSAAIAGVPAVHAAEPEATVLEEVIVTAQKRSENLQDVPLSIQSLNTEKLKNLHITNLDDFIKFLPSVSYVRSRGQGGNGQPGSSQVYMRGVVSGGDGNSSGSQPSVGTYLDEQPVTSANGTLDVHVYDIARVEALAGPQGSLYGASSQAGTVRIITNKPDASGVKAGYEASGSSTAHGGIGYEAQGFLNVPITSRAAIRLVGWDRHDAGFIDNVAGTGAPGTGIVNGVRTYPTWSAYCAAQLPPCTGGSISNAAVVKNDYNTSETLGGRGALKIDINDSWTVTPAFMAQSTKSDGFFAYDPAVGDLKVTHFTPEKSADSFTQSALTIEGKISNFDVVYAGAYMKRNREIAGDYSDYSYFYDKLYGSGSSIKDDLGAILDPTQQALSRRHQSRVSNELRVSSSKDARLKGTVGIFFQRQTQDIEDRYFLPNSPTLAANRSIPGWPATIWLTEIQRVDKDSAAFGQLTYDLTPKLAVTGGIRFYKADNSLQGFYGFNTGISGGTGIAKCGPTDPAQPRDPTYQPFNGAPCTNLNKATSESGSTPRFNLTYKFDADHMIYATYSRGFRPGGSNRQNNVAAPPYKADFLTNYEIGWKTQTAGRKLRFNGAVFVEDWKDFQFSFLAPPGSLTVIANAGQARIKGVEADVQWVASGNLTFQGSLALLDAKLTQDYCGETIDVTSCPGKVTTFRDGGAPFIGPLAPSGTTLPVTPKLKANLITRYSFALRDWDGNAQLALVYQGASEAALKIPDRQRLGVQPAYTQVDLSAGLARNGLGLDLVVGNVLDERAQLTRFAQCSVTKCGQTYILPSQPRTIGIKISQKF